MKRKKRYFFWCPRVRTASKTLQIFLSRRGFGESGFEKYFSSFGSRGTGGGTILGYGLKILR